jgi:hypothetical protein
MKEAYDLRTLTAELTKIFSEIEALYLLVREGTELAACVRMWTYSWK